jgi:copper oxidase (laccase) domain-containing protein
MYFISKLLTSRNIRHGISTVEEGNLDHRFGQKDEVVANRKKFLDQIRIPIERSVFLEVQHGTKIIEATTSLAGIGFYSSAAAIKADAIFTKEKNLAPVMLTADCIPALFYDRANQIVGLVHLSRHNTKEAFAQIVASFMRREYSTSMQELKIFFGPSIKKESYIIDEYPEGYDLVAENINQLLLKGIREENIFVDPIDTAASKDFFSHYRAVRNKEDEGRFATVVMLV